VLKHREATAELLVFGLHYGRYFVVECVLSGAVWWQRVTIESGVCDRTTWSIVACVLSGAVWWQRVTIESGVCDRTTWSIVACPTQVTGEHGMTSASTKRSLLNFMNLT